MKDKKNKEARNKVKEAEKKLKEKLAESTFSGDDIKKIIRHCEKLVETEHQVELQAQQEIPTN